MTSRSFIASALISLLIPVSALALEGIGPRVTVTGIVGEVRISKDQAFKEEGGEFIITATNGQIVTVIFTKETEITSEGRLSRKLLIPANITEGMHVRVRGWRLDSKSLTASLFIILNIEANPGLSGNGVIQSIDEKGISVLGTDGVTRSYVVTNDTEVNLSYTLYGRSALELTGKQAIFTLNPTDKSQIRILRITGTPDATRSLKPTSVELKRR